MLTFTTLVAATSAIRLQAKRYCSSLAAMGGFVTYLSTSLVATQRSLSYVVLSRDLFPTKIPGTRSRQLRYLAAGKFLCLFLLYSFSGTSPISAQNTPSESYQAHIEVLMSAIGKGDVAAMFELGQHYSLIQGDYEKAHGLMLQAGERGHIDAMLELATNYRLKRVTPKDSRNEAYWSERAIGTVKDLAQTGNTDAQYRLATFFREGFHSIPKDLPKSVHWYTTAAQQGHREAMSMLSIAYSTDSLGVVQDNELATYWKLASMGLKLQPDLAQEMTFGEYCDGNHLETCNIFGEGIVTERTVDDFRKLVMERGFEADTIVLNSVGGNLGAGIELGRLIRETRKSTAIGDPRTRLTFIENYEVTTPAECSSACAYAFLGGDQRFLSEGDKLGFHQFFLAGGGNIEMGAAQELSGQIVQYIVEMGVDARIFTLASSQGASGLKYIDEATATDSGIITRSGYSAFFLEPYGQGVIAAAKRLDPGGAYDVVFQVTAFCKSGDPYLLFSSNATPDRTADFVLNSDSNEYRISKNDVRVSQARISDSALDIGLLEVRLPAELAKILETSESVSTYFEFTRAEGGFFQSYLNFSDLDREMLQLAFRVCI